LAQTLIIWLWKPQLTLTLKKGLLLKAFSPQNGLFHQGQWLLLVLDRPRRANL